MNAEYFKILTVKQGIKLYLKTGMLLTRGMTAKKLRGIASQYTGVVYPNSRIGSTIALADVQNIIDNIIDNVKADLV